MTSGADVHSTVKAASDRNAIRPASPRSSDPQQATYATTSGPLCTYSPSWQCRCGVADVTCAPPRSVASTAAGGNRTVNRPAAVFDATAALFTELSLRTGSTGSAPSARPTGSTYAYAQELTLLAPAGVAGPA